MNNPNIKILIVAYIFPPINTPSSQRPYFMAKFLKNHFINSVVLTSGNAYSPYGTDDSFNLKGLNIIYTSPVNMKAEKMYFKKRSFIRTIKNLPLIRGFINTAIKFFLIPDKGILWYKTAVKRGSKLLKDEPDINLIYASSPSFANHLIAIKLAKKFNKKIVIDIRDFYYVDHKEEKNNLRVFADKKIELKVLKAANYVTFVSKSMLKAYKQKYPFIAAKSSLIYNGFDNNEFTNINVHSSQNNQFTIFYVGTFYQGKRNPWPLLLALEFLIVNNQIDIHKLHIKIAGEIPFDFEKKLNGLNISKCIELLGFISRKKTFSLMQESNLLWLIIGNDKWHYQTIPLKTFEYIASKKPILLFSPEEAEVREIIEENKIGIWFKNSVEPGIIIENEKKLMALYSDWQQNKMMIEKKGAQIDDQAINKFKRSFQAEQLAQIIFSVNKN